MEKNRIRLLFLALIPALFLLGGCRNIKDIQVRSVRVESLDVKGFRGADIVLGVEVDNPSVRISVSEIEGELKHSGKVLGKVAMAPFVLEAKTQKKYSMEASASVAEGVSFKDLMILGDLRRLEECTIDLSAEVKIKGGGKRKIAINDIPLKELLERVSK